MTVASTDAIARPAIVVSEFMDDAAVARLAARHPTAYDPHLVDDPERLAGLLADARALIVRNRTEVRGDLLAHGARLEIVGRLGVGLDNIDTDACAARGIAVRAATGANAASVAEYVIAAIMMLARGAYQSSAAVAAGEWPRARLMGGEVAGKVLGLAGLGGTARDVAMRARALGMTVIAADPLLPDDHEAWGLAEKADFPDVVATADFVSLHVPLVPATRHLLDAAMLARMKPGACLVNTARGGVVDDRALAAALRSGHLGGAALDVFEVEPLTAEAGAIFDGIDNLVLTPHIAGVTRESNVRVSQLIADMVLERLG